ncbi:hypothetical protein BDY17DRAFT_163585 [Neohortaea acidophila]|uniref:DNA replication checkpoint mediator MRC1 domain-containing protein n=1 Tax=Neohortaea acidophila TaxID=245834 RepID=A0A6A6PTV3_9PEZI|nr:uncharacterized protein BDY17DRAFT_163585 [Neohortaea acidophila]KAF2482647.1 hypothetical protein BDY17DRAFT_163585 [Neohortaea acidophila]
MSTASSSPASNRDGASTVEMLTPRTKVARMLADIDDEIDNAPSPSPSKDAQVGRPLTNPDLDVHQLPASCEASSMPTQHSASDSEEDDEEEIRKPQGRAARRMLHTKSNTSSALDVSPRQKNPSLQQPAAGSDSDDDDLYSATPMKISSRARSDSPSPRGTESGNGLFVSPAKSIGAQSEDDLPTNPFGGKEKLAELVAQKRAERLEREAEEKARKKAAAHAGPSSDLPDEMFEDAQDPVDPNIEQIMSDATRPSRKASKKALLEMERETQRLTRQQALAHQMKVKKKFTTTDLFAKFNFRQSPALPPTVIAEKEAGTSSAPSSDDIEEREPASTPPSSPPTPLDRQKSLVDHGALNKLVPTQQHTVAAFLETDADDEDLPDIAEVLKSSQIPTARRTSPAKEAVQENRGLKLARLGKKAMRQDDSSDDDLDIVPNLPAHLQVFEKATGSKGAKRSADSKAIQHLKHLAHLHVNDVPARKKSSRPSVAPQTLDLQLRKKAKEQARQAQLERIEELRAKGIEIQSVEEREREAEAFEDLLEKARQDALKLRQAEKAVKKGADGGDAMVASEDEDEDEDEDYSDSGSDMEQDGNDLVDAAAEEASEEEEEDEDEDEDGDDEAEDEDVEVDEAPEIADVDSNEQDDVALDPVLDGTDDTRTELATPAAPSRKARVSRVIRDEDDEDLVSSEHEDAPSTAKADDPFAAFNFGAAGNTDAFLSPTQAFNATMQTPTQTTQEDSYDILRRIAPPSVAAPPDFLLDLDTQMDDEPQTVPTDESQVPESQRVDLQWETQPPETPAPAHLKRGNSALTETPGWEPSPDPGLPSPWDLQLRGEWTASAGVEHETQSTVRLRVSESPAPSQAPDRRGRLIRRRVAESDESDEDVVPAASIRAEKKDAFREMRRRQKEALTTAERAEADKEMRAMMDEQAEESEDEYAGLGGDDFVAPETEEDKEMIDSSHIEVDERAIAAHFAERQRISDEAEISKLYKEVTTGGFRKRMGANAFDLEEDEDEMAARRRQMRQQEEARKRKALLKDVNVASLAEGRQSKGKNAFLRAIADDDGEDDLVKLSSDEDESASATQNTSQASQSRPTSPLRETSGNKRRLPPAGDDVDREGRPTKQRRTRDSALRRPTSLLQVQESVSFLLEEPNAAFMSGASATELLSDSEGEEPADRASDTEDDTDLVAAEAARSNDGGFAPNPASFEAKIVNPAPMPAVHRRTAPKTGIVDRLSLKRMVSNPESAHGRTAWAAGPTTGGFKVPSLLRRATTNVATGANERGVSVPSLSRESSGVKMGGTKKSSLAYQARAEERRAIVEASAKRREENTARIAQLRRNSSALSRGLTGRFE